MLRKIILILAATFAAGLLFVNIYTSLVDAPNWGSNMPTSIQATRDYYKAANPGNFFRIFSPINQVLALLALVLCWKTNKRIRLFYALALVFAITGDLFTFAYFYPRNEIMFHTDIVSNLAAIKSAWTEWSTMNWIRSLIVTFVLFFSFSALLLFLKSEK